MNAHIHRLSRSGICRPRSARRGFAPDADSTWTHAAGRDKPLQPTLPTNVSRWARIGPDIRPVAGLPRGQARPAAPRARRAWPRSGRCLPSSAWPSLRDRRWPGRSRRLAARLSNTYSNLSRRYRQPAGPSGRFPAGRSAANPGHSGRSIATSGHRASDVQRQIWRVDNSGRYERYPKRPTFFHPHLVDNILAARGRCYGEIIATSTVQSPSRAQAPRRVCTGYPQACAQHDWTRAGDR